MGTIDGYPAGPTVRRRFSRVGLAAISAVVMAAGMLALGTTSASAAPPEGAAVAETQEAQLLYDGCRKITAFRVSVYNSQTGGTVVDQWPDGMTFAHYGQSLSSPYRWQSWMPRGVPPDHPSAYTVWVANSGHHGVPCPW